MFGIQTLIIDQFIPLTHLRLMLSFRAKSKLWQQFQLFGCASIAQLVGKSVKTSSFSLYVDIDVVLLFRLQVKYKCGPRLM